MSKMAPKKILIPSIVLTVICLVITAALAFTNDITKDKIKIITKSILRTEMRFLCVELLDSKERITTV